ncbi:MAG: acetate/propionate family kinase [Acidobacteria bacterium]|nr:acetate/propionate family kinase [Acidobacteriota bacterium]
MSSARVVLSLNSGSSSFKFGLYRLDDEPRLLARGAARQEDGGYRLEAQGPSGDDLHVEGSAATDQPGALAETVEALGRAGLPTPDGLGHRIVHGGPTLRAPARVDDAVLDELRHVIPLAPLHLPQEIALIEAAAQTFPQTPQAVCFDTAFHADMPEVARRMPLPRELWAEGVRRYGFHGLSYESVVAALGGRLRRRAVIAHLGNGASLAAVLDGRCVDTTMGLTPAGGLMMGTRCGDIDPGALVYLLRERKLTVKELDELVNERSGLLGVSGGVSDMKRLLELRASEAAAAQAVEMFCRIARKHIAAMAAALGGMEQLVFTGAIGARSAEIRREICAGLGFLGVALDEGRNERAEAAIEVEGAACEVRIVPTQEEKRIAELTGRTLWP